MNLQYITDSNGKTTGVYIPIKEWNDLTSKFKDIDREGIDIPNWHKKVVRKRMELYKSDPTNANDFEQAMAEIEKDL